MPIFANTAMIFNSSSRARAMCGMRQKKCPDFLSTFQGGTSVTTYCTVRLKHITHAKKFSREATSCTYTHNSPAVLWTDASIVAVPRSKLRLCFTSPTGSVLLTIHDKGHEYMLEYCRSTVKGHDRHHKGSSTRL